MISGSSLNFVKEHALWHLDFAVFCLLWRLFIKEGYSVSKCPSVRAAGQYADTEATQVSGFDSDTEPADTANLA